MYDTYVSIDLETTGLNPKRDRIIEIGAIRVEQGQIVEEFSTFVDPGRKLEERITELTGIRDEDLADAPQLDEVFPQLLEFMGELPLLGHRILFDYSFEKSSSGPEDYFREIGGGHFAGRPEISAGTASS